MTPTLRSAISDLYEVFEYEAVPVIPTRWQGMDVSKQPAAEMREMLHVNLEARLMDVLELEYYRKAIQPNLPWADKHFDERVCGLPINPGVEWANWPWGVNAEKSLGPDGMFNHNYMERYWPVLAGYYQKPTRTPLDMMNMSTLDNLSPPVKNRGIRHQYGDLGGLVRDLAAEPDTRQAYLPVWFPEDTGDAHRGRKPCTLGYHFIMRNGKLDVVYYLRSCDFAHHFRDDVYLTIRLLLWVLQECRNLNAEWNKVKPGKLVMQITSLHMFINDFRKEYPE
jgi:hypothetical protein